MSHADLGEQHLHRQLFNVHEYFVLFYIFCFDSALIVGQHDEPIYETMCDGANANSTIKLAGDEYEFTDMNCSVDDNLGLVETNNPSIGISNLYDDPSIAEEATETGADESELSCYLLTTNKIATDADVQRSLSILSTASM